MPHMEHNLGAWFFSCVCVWINVFRRGKLVRSNTLHQPNWLDPLPHTRMALVRIPVRQLEMPKKILWVPTRGVPLSSTQTRYHMYHIWLSAPTTPHHFQLSSSPSRQAPPPPSPDDASLRRRICVAAANSAK